MRCLERTLCWIESHERLEGRNPGRDARGRADFKARRPEPPDFGAARNRRSDLGHADRERQRDATGFFRDAKINYNDVVFWSKPSDWQNQTTTPNASAHYVYFNINTKNGPVVVEIPPAVEAGF